MSEIKIQDFLETDIKSAVKIEEMCFSRPWSENSFKSALENQYSKFFVAKKSDVLVGFSGMYTAAKSEGYIYNIAVNPIFRKQGIGTALTLKLLEHSKKNHLEFLSLEVRESNNSAISIYEKCGFQKIGIRKNFYDCPIENAFIMTCYFK